MVNAEMKNSIRARMLIFDNDRMLLVKLVDPKDGYVFWVTPGGWMEEDETIFECAERETLEETSLRVRAGRVVYLHQYIDHQVGLNCLEVFLICEEVGGSLIRQAGEVEEVGYFSREETMGMNVLPRIFMEHVWSDYDKGFPEIRFLGVTYPEKG
jgi:8-oxo-dGTP pyrophosphatase MutT (NUDIX family)